MAMNGDPTAPPPVVGTDGDDLLQGGAGDDRLLGSTGNDTLMGGDGADTVDYSAAAGGVTANLASGTATVKGLGSNAVIANAGFENTPTSDGEVQGYYAPAGWEGTNEIVLWNPIGPAEEGVSGQNVANLNGQSSLSQTLSETFNPDRVYDLSLRLCDYQGGGDATAVTVNLYAGDTVIGTCSFNPDEGVWNNIRITVEAAGVPDAAALAGHPLKIEVVNNAAPSTPGTEIWNDINVDDVSLTVFAPKTDTLSEVENLTGSDHDDALTGDDGVNVLQGGGGADTLSGAGGDDTLTGGAGNDRFVFVGGSGSDRITDFNLGAPGSPLDQIDVSDLRTLDGGPVTWRDVVVSDDGDGNAVLTFPRGESVVLEGIAPGLLNSKAALAVAGVPCFTPGTAILTPQGEVPVEALCPGDLVCTADNGPQPLLWIGRRDVVAPPSLLRPIRLRAGAFGNRRDLMVSPQHAVVLPVAAPGGGDALVRARHLVEALPGFVRVAQGKRRVSYIHLLFDRHQVIFAEGALTESFFPGAQGLGALDRSARSEVLALFPELAFRAAEVAFGPRARALMRRRDVASGIGTGQHRSRLRACIR